MYRVALIHPETVGELHTKISPHKEFPTIYDVLYIQVCLAHYIYCFGIHFIWKCSTFFYLNRCEFESAQ